MEIVKGGVTAPLGFSAAGVACGIKKRGKDLALIVSGPPAVAVGTLTVNRMRASSVGWAAEVLRRGRARAIVANSGNANCCTGRRGERDTREMAQLTGRLLGIPAGEVLVGSTGVIGRALPMERVRQGIAEAAQNLIPKGGSLSAAEAIMTTDMRPKELAVRFRAGGALMSVGGIAKGSGMIAPNMATMFGFLSTDARAERPLLRRILKQAVEESFNAITVDGEMSTNDMVLLLANGAAGAPAIRPGTPAARELARAVQTVCRYLAREIVRDGEGVTRLMRVKVSGARTAAEAKQVARQIANSALVKTMVAGRDPNWGRVASAVGASGIPVDPQRLTLRFGSTVVYRRGEPARAPQEILLKEADQPEVQICVELGRGKAQAQMLSGDFTEGYIRINAKYTT
ncbi:MAG: bifunctional glutamate N-acetyltransferase/amino-acid acetyltransferase ArgJ [Candidatus Omnitrophica bacterium]|nr:bifunctional glutamate N-acetyltransferase/amino-acid acetyltransferase ArgJ [Candidatus Omnitrophota bacterium]